ncbi:MAG: hypothetical protein PHG31_03060 [Candidatus Omnitrophica bacterium]|nr:hypothetical protein [Candidatus Omnitrophota bacterium]
MKHTNKGTHKKQKGAVAGYEKPALVKFKRLNAKVDTSSQNPVATRGCS